MERRGHGEGADAPYRRVQMPRCQRANLILAYTWEIHQVLGGILGFVIHVVWIALGGVGGGPQLGKQGE